MKSKKLIAGIGAVVLIVAAAVSYFVFRSNDGYCQAIPEDAIALGRIDAKTLVEQTELDVKSLLKQYNLEDENTDASIDLASPIYCFVAPNMTVGIVAKLDDADQFATFINDQAAKNRVGQVEEQRGLKWAQLDTYVMAVWDDDKVLVLSGKTANEMRNTMAEYMAQDKDNSILATPLYDEVKTSKEGLALIVDGAKGYELVKQTVPMAEMMNTLPTSDVHLKMTFGIDGSVATLASEVIPQTEEAKTFYKTQLEAYDEIDADLIDRGMSNPIFWMGMNVDGEKLLENIKGLPGIGQMLVLLDTQVDVSKITRSLDGDIALAVSVPNGNLNNTPSLLLYAESDNTDFMDDIPTWKNVTFRELKDGKFYAKMGGDEMFLGKSKKGFYLTNKEDVADNCDKTAVGLEDLKSDIKDSYFYATIDLQQLAAIAGNVGQGKMIAEAFKDELAALDRMTLRSKGLHAELTLSLKAGNDIVKTCKAIMVKLSSATGVFNTPSMGAPVQTPQVQQEEAPSSAALDEAALDEFGV